MDSSTELAITFFTILALLANIATVGIIGMAVAAGLARHGRVQADSASEVPAAPEAWWSALRRDLSPMGAVGLAWLVAAVSMGGSLYFSESAGFEPCRLCWYQRGFMYPLVALLAITGWAVYRDGSSGPSTWLRRLGMLAALGGAGVATWHWLIERFPSLEETSSCDLTNPCSLIWFERLGFITLPYMAFSGFVLIVTLLAFASLPTQPRTDANAERDTPPAGDSSPSDPTRTDNDTSLKETTV